MSDPVSNNEIEDVLSSIRRLVSDDAKVAKAPDRLVLKPSQRIPDQAGTPAGEEPDSIEQSEEEPDMSSLASLIGDEVERALDDAFPSDETGADFDEIEEVLASVAPENTASIAEEAPASDAVAEQPTPTDDAPEYDLGDSVLEQKIAALEQLVSQKDDEWEQDTDGATAPMFQHNPARSLEWSKNDSDETAPDDQDALLEHVHTEEVEPDEPAFEQPAAVESEPDMVEKPDEQEETRSQVHVDSTVTPFVLHTAPDPEDDPSATELANTENDLLADNIVALDEEALREMVGEMVRRELQGALGERITRNVRKLVRREIHRAMVAREFD